MTVSTPVLSREVIRIRVHGDNGLLPFRSLGLSKKACVCWDVVNAPDDVLDVTLGLVPDANFVTVVPHSMRFSHVPDGVKLMAELKDGFVCVE